MCVYISFSDYTSSHFQQVCGGQWVPVRLLKALGFRCKAMPHKERGIPAWHRETHGRWEFFEIKIVCCKRGPGTIVFRKVKQLRKKMWFLVLGGWLEFAIWFYSRTVTLIR